MPQVPAKQDVGQVVREAVLGMLQHLGEAGRTLADTDGLSADLGFDSADLLHLVTILNTRLHADPFEQRTAMTAVHTVGDLCQAYQQALAGNADRSDMPDATLRASQQRAQMRRARRKSTS